jgi:hypothetical protein
MMVSLELMNVTGHKTHRVFGQKIFANGRMNPAMPKERLPRVHPENEFKVRVSFRAKKVQFERSGTLPELGFAFSQKPILDAFCKVDYRVAK